MRIQAFVLAMILLLPGCFSEDEEEITFNGRDLGGSDTYMFTLEDAQGPLWNLSDQEGKVVILVFMFTRCDNTCPVTSQNVKMVQDTLTEDELEKISIVSVTVDWRHDSPSELRNWTEDRGYDWPHLTDWNSDQIRNTYSEYDIVPYDEEAYQEVHLQPVYILDTDLKGRVVWIEYDWPIDLFMEDLRTVIDLG